MTTPKKTLRTSEIARLAKVHPNTVRLYEQWGLLCAVPREENGYRVYSQVHLDQMVLARIALRCEFVEGAIREKALKVVKTAVDGNYQKALNYSYAYLTHIKKEQSKAAEALILSKKWLKGQIPLEEETFNTRRQAANYLEVTTEVLRNWERNGLIRIRKDMHGRRIYGPEELSRLKIIRTLRSANHSIMAILRMINVIDGSGNGNDLKNDYDCEIVSATDDWISALQKTESDALELICHIKKIISQAVCSSGFPRRGHAAYS